MKITSCTSTSTVWGPEPLNLNSTVCSTSIFPERFLFKSISSREYGQGGYELLLKNSSVDSYPTNHVIDRAGFTMRGASGTLEFFAKPSFQI